MTTIHERASTSTSTRTTTRVTGYPLTLGDLRYASYCVPVFELDYPYYPIAYSFQIQRYRIRIRIKSKGERGVIVTKISNVRITSKGVYCQIADVLADASAAYLHLTNNLKCDPRSIILYGQSLGTGQKKTPHIY
eukprot:676333-Amorphochlora_amoeboformis.AAC.1